MGQIIAVAGGPLASGPTSGGKVYAYNSLDAVTPVLVAPANTGRQKITFHNPGTVDVVIFPQYVQNTGSNVAATTTIAAKGGGLLVFSNGGEKSVEGECQGAWYALAASGFGNPLTVIDTNT